MTVTTSIADGLRTIVGPAHVLSGEVLAAYSLATVRPQVAVLPAGESEISRVLSFAWEEHLGVVAWGGGRHQSLGRQPARYDLALDLTRLNRVLEYEPADMTARAQAGIRLADLQRELGAHGQFLPLDPPLADGGTLGGVLAANLSGSLRCRYGTARDLVLGIRVAHADGTITKGGAKVVKNVTGYDITKLYIGSLGTLGIILEATFRVYPRPVAEQGWWLSAGELEAIQALAIRVLRSPLVPNRVELLEEGAGEACGFATRTPMLLVSCAGVPEAVRAQGDELARLAGELGIVPSPLSSPEGTWAALRDFPWEHSSRSGPGHRVTWRGGVLPADCAKGMQQIRQATRPRARVGMAASVASGTLRGVIQVEAPEALAGCVGAARQALEGLGGFLVVLDAPESVRTLVDVWGPPPEGHELMRRLKMAFDARGILNPGRFVGGL